ncbi:MAG: hypothetical protein RLZZ173_1443, partial [Pseudomonadota bacterium]
AVILLKLLQALKPTASRLMKEDWIAKRIGLLCLSCNDEILIPNLHFAELALGALASLG